MVWTGEEMIVWGGSAIGGDGLVDVGSGAIYDPATDRWAPMIEEGAPTPRAGAAALWTGEEMIVWGGRSEIGARDDGARFAPGE